MTALNANQIHERASNALEAVGCIISSHHPDSERARAMLAALGECSSAAVWLERLAARVSSELETALDDCAIHHDMLCGCRTCRDARADARLADIGDAWMRDVNGESLDEWRRRRA